MPAAVIAAGITAVGAIGGGLLASSGSQSAANAQVDAAGLGIAEQQREYNQTRTDLLPWLNAGRSGLGGELDLLGLNGAGAQQSAITGIQNSPQFASLDRAGTQAILQNASATGGLRGGNVQSSLYNNRADLLAQLIDQQYSRLGALSGAGASTGAQLGGFGQQSANAISSLFGAQGAARAGGILGGYQGFGQALQGVTGFLNTPGLFGGGGGNTTGFTGGDPTMGLFGADPTLGLFADGSFSDRRLKTKIKKVGEFEDGLGIYEFAYKADPSQMFKGVMADEVKELRPQAYVPNYRGSGFDGVNYGVL